MRLLTKLQYIQSLSAEAQEQTPSAEVVDRILQYVADVSESLELKRRELKTSDLVATYRHGERFVFHLKAFPRKAPETFVIVLADATAEKIEGHILIDMKAEYSDPILECPSCDYADTPKVDEIEALIEQINPDDDNPFAILATGDGTYIQTMCTPDGYVLEYQLVNPSSHYETPHLVSMGDVVDAMKSFGFGKNEWLELYDWQWQAID